MTAKTTLEQSCSTLKDGLGSTRFQVSSTVSFVATGDLPGQSIFVYQLGTPTDPKTDVFLRIGDIQDVTSLVIGRDAALLNNKATYLANGFTVQFDDVATANAAKQLIQAKVDQLITDWHIYNDEFVNGSVTTYPLLDASLVASKKGAYTTAKKAKDAADAVVLSLASSVSSKQAAAQAAAEKQTLLQNISLECISTKNALTNLVSPEAAFVTYVQGVVATLNAYTSAPDLATLKAIAAGLETARTTAVALVQAPLGALVSTVTASCGTKAIDANSAAAARAVADAAISAAQREAIVAQQKATSAQVALEGALAEVVAVCPTFDPAA